MNNKNLTPFKMCVINNFPFIEADFDALNNYELLCKIVEYLNNVIASQNEVISNVNELSQAFTELQNFVDNYFENLDVQEEINNKLDEMAESGDLTNLIKAYVDPIYEEYETTINNSISAFEDEVETDISEFKGIVNGNILDLTNRINGVASGSPIPVSSTSSMTDTTKVYVNTTDGKWYYYDGTNWVAGGTYQSTGISDGEITRAKLNSTLIGDIVMKQNYISANSDLNDYLQNGLYVMLNGQYTHCYTNGAINTSFLKVEVTFTGTSITNPVSSIIIQTIQDRSDKNLIYKRIIYGTPDNLTYGNWFKELTDSDVMLKQNYIGGGTDLNDILNKGYYVGTSGNYTNAPINSMTSFFMEVKESYTGSYSYKNYVVLVQTIYVNSTNKIYSRNIYGTVGQTYTYNSWKLVNADIPDINILTLGDSILGMPYQYITQEMQTHTNGNVYNCNFGGTTAVDRVGSSYRNFSFVNLADAIVANDFSDQDADIITYSDTYPSYFSSSLTLLKSIDLSTIDVCLIMYGTNDFNSNYEIGSISAEENKTDILGSLKYGIKKLSEEYPNIRFIILNPIYRKFANGDSLTYKNTNNDTLNDLDNKELELANNLYIDSIDMRKLGINSYNYSSWLEDNVHLKNSVKNIVGDFISNNIN